MDIYKESNCIEMDFITQLDFPPEWIFPTSTASVNNDSDIIESSLKNHLSNFSVDDLFIKVIMTKERVKQMLTYWKQEPKIAGRFNILEEAIEAHIENKFHLSVSTLIPQIEGLLRDSLQAMGRSADFGSMSREDMRRATQALNDLWMGQPHALIETAFLLKPLPCAIGDLYDKYESSESGKLYRHGVCHGLQKDFGTEKNSLRLILLLDRIIFFYVQ